MLRLTFLLCAGLFLVMLLGGRDFGQMRPGLARAVAERPLASAAAPAVETAALVDSTAELPARPVEPAVVAVVPPVVPVAAPITPVAKIAEVAQAASPAAPENAVFTLSAFADAAPEAPVAAVPEQAAEGEIWYVAGNSLNVRAGPSTQDNVVGKLSQGEAVLVVLHEGSDWARIRIEGDGIEGYVATRFLTPDAPAYN